jgi:hypothetical protein
MYIFLCFFLVGVRLGWNSLLKAVSSPPGTAAGALMQAPYIFVYSFLIGVRPVGFFCVTAGIWKRCE